MNGTVIQTSIFPSHWVSIYFLQHIVIIYNLQEITNQLLIPYKGGGVKSGDPCFKITIQTFGTNKLVVHIFQFLCM